MTDPDDVEAISLDYAVRDFVAACEQLAYPWAGFLEFAYLLAAACVDPRNHDLPFRRIVLTCLRRVRQDILLGL